MATTKARGQDINVWLLWFGILGGPLVWGGHETISYLMVPYVCATGLFILLHVVTVGAVVITVAAGYCAFRGWKSTPMKEQTDMPGRTGRNSFMGLAGLCLSAFFLLIIIVESSGNYFFSPCEFRQGMQMAVVPAIREYASIETALSIPPGISDGTRLWHER